MRFQPERSVRGVLLFESQRRLAKALRDWSGKRGFPLFDLAAFFDNLEAAYFCDECHLTMDNHRTLAEALAPVLSRKALLANAA
jgi:hypothetical protein